MRYYTLYYIFIKLNYFLFDVKYYRNQITYAEVNCKGVGAKKDGRVPWEKTLDESQLSKYTRQSFVDQEGWINQQP